MRYQGHLLYLTGRFCPGVTPISRKSVCLVCLWFEMPKGIVNAFWNIHRFNLQKEEVICHFRRSSSKHTGHTLAVALFLSETNVIISSPPPVPIYLHKRERSLIEAKPRKQGLALHYRECRKKKKKDTRTATSGFRLS